MKNENGVIAIYSRKSKFTGKGESIGNQVDLCREYVRLHYGEKALETALVFEDEGFSGGNTNRPAFQRMMAQVERGEIGTLVVYRLDRVSRNVSDFSGMIENLKHKDVTFVSIRENFDTSTPMGRAMMYIASVFSQLERETIAERIRDNMHELAKTGRWLGGNTPTGYKSESVKSVTVDGKTKKACKLKLIPEEAEIVKTIFDLFTQTGSLTMTEAELLKRRLLTKNENQFTRFAIKAILQNPVYMIADEDAFEYFRLKGSEVFSSREAFDGVHGILAYNRTDQEKGKTTVFNPVNEWIVSVGKHPGIIPGKVWVAVQDNLERNKSKAYRRPRKNEALLTGLVFCACGNRMYPRLSKRTTADGEPIYTYVCKMKERSKKELCKRRNANGNTLDVAIIEQLKRLADEKSDFARQLEKSKMFYTGDREEYERRLASMRKEKADLEKKVSFLVDTLAETEEGAVKKSILNRLGEMNLEIDKLSMGIEEMVSLASEHALSDIEFDVLRQLLTMIKNGFDDMTYEQKRVAIRTVVRRIIWDGENAHIVLFGAEGEDIEYPDIAHLMKDSAAEAEEDEDLVPFIGEDMDENSLSDFGPETKTHWGEDSK
ncbi:MAG: recombinase family protein [Oscillospiraceae bacterium]|nr:recombinase family protein [Oscillospiraceae bacterium]